MDLGGLGILPRIVLEIAALRLGLGTYRYTTCTLYMYSSPILVSKMDSTIIIIKPMHALLLQLRQHCFRISGGGGGGGVGNPMVSPPPPTL